MAQDGRVLRERPASRSASQNIQGELVDVSTVVQVCASGGHIPCVQQKVAGELMLNVEIKFLNVFNGDIRLVVIYFFEVEEPGGKRAESRDHDRIRRRSVLEQEGWS